MKKVFPFIFLSFALAWGIWVTVWLMGIKLGQPIQQIGTIIAMWMPALAYFILKAVNPRSYRLGAGFRLAFKKNWKFFLLAMWGPTILTFIGVVLYFLVFREQFSLSFSSLGQMLAELGVKTPALPLEMIVLSQVLAAMTYGPVVNSFLAMGEEIGWRGFLFPTLREEFSPLHSHLLVGLIWSLWHLPINLQGYNFGLTYWAYPWWGILAMFFFCFSVGVLLSYMMEKTHTLWAPALLHGAVNASAGIGMLFQISSQQTLAMRIFGPSPVGLLAGLPFFFVAIWILSKERK